MGEATRRAAWCLASFLAINLPFFLWDPGAYLGSVFAPFIEPLEPYGVGLERFGVLGPLPLWPRGAYAALTIAAFLALAVAYWRSLPGGALVFPLPPLYFAWRALQSYFAFLPFLALIATDEPGSSPNDRRVSQR